MPLWTGFKIYVSSEEGAKTVRGLCEAKIIRDVAFSFLPRTVARYNESPIRIIDRVNDSLDFLTAQLPPYLRYEVTLWNPASRANPDNQNSHNVPVPPRRRLVSTGSDEAGLLAWSHLGGGRAWVEAEADQKCNI
jgi:hypothetical protein